MGFYLNKTVYTVIESTQIQNTKMAKKGILQLLKEGPVVGDGSMCMTLEKRGYCRAGPWTPEAVLLYPEAVRQLLREYLRSGADVLQTPCFYSSDGKLEVTTEKKKPTYSTKELSDAAWIMAHEVANEGSSIVCGSLSPVISYTREGDLQKARQEFERQLEPFMEHNVDFILAEFFAFIGEVELCVDVMKKANKPIACTMRIGEHGDENGVSVEECALRMARTGADIIGINCMYDISTNLKTLKRMKVALDAADLHPYLMVQPLGFRCPEVEKEPIVGYLSLPDAPLALDSRVLTRTEVHQFTRAAYDIGVCCNTGNLTTSEQSLKSLLLRESGPFPSTTCVLRTVVSSNSAPSTSSVRNPATRTSGRT